MKDQDYSWAEVFELGPGPPSMEAAKALDAMGSLPGYKVKTGDARGAYTQSLLRGAETWVALPENRWPEPWKASVGGQLSDSFWHFMATPHAGGFWEERCRSKHMSVGFESIAEDWHGVYWRTATRSLLIG